MNTPARVVLGMLLILMCAHGATAQVAVRAATLHTMGPAGTIQNGVVVITDGKIAAVGPAPQVAIPAGYRVIEAAVAVPGLIDAHSTVGLSGLFNTRHDSDQLERSTPIQPELRAIDAYNPNDRLVEWVRSFGITTVHTGHAPGEAVSGQTIIVKTIGRTVEEALVSPLGAIACTMGPGAQKDGGRSPGTRAKVVAILRAELIKAREYAEKVEAAADGKKPDRNLRLESLAAALRGEVPMLITAQRAQDIEAALRLKDEFGFRMILDGGAEATLLAERLKAAGVPVIVHPTMMRAYGETENASFTTAAKLRDAGLLIALQSGYEGYVPKTRVVLFEAGLAAARGLGFGGALASITIDAARLLGIDSRVGSLEAGKDGDIALYDGDPFEYTTHCVGVIINGAVVSDVQR
ncbi:MAG: amidohydrolase family protein [Phycisphaeraceae bacterium]|nr:amidohydrolase family protein [Phycisphaeraceae bacterium]